jgi:hypothetical protein
MSQYLSIEDLAEECKIIIADARKTLGHDLGGCSTLDLVADNIDYANLDDLQKALVSLGEAKA